MRTYIHKIYLLHFKILFLYFSTFTPTVQIIDDMYKPLHASLMSIYIYDDIIEVISWFKMVTLQFCLNLQEQKLEVDLVKMVDEKWS